ncbi:MAG: hypothetical protein KGJ23_07730 [Euryarchaeota archaeon]|nr:hypothetical protein [Euryarchaeota archaeon]MDE1836489.1 hypothetical protein [Euryarchaeota archaeon]MDE1880246.1 hypothetical protein [Euryarchaeota archaeon]MDE2044695.1 hypothetical protein [Thermoplasmata archaeon]
MPTKKRQRTNEGERATTTERPAASERRAGMPVVRATLKDVLALTREAQAVALDAQKAVNSARDLACDVVIAGTYVVERTLDRLFGLLDRV